MSKEHKRAKAETPALISTHIEKTGGTSLQIAYEKLYGASNIFLYYPQTDSVTRASYDRLSGSVGVANTLKQLLAPTALYPYLYPLIMKIRTGSAWQHPADDLPSDFKVVHGHFVANRFDGVVAKPALRSVVLRDPLTRMISHYERWRRARGNVMSRITIPYNSSITFRDFSMKKELQNYQLQALGEKSLEEFDLVGVTERLDVFGDKLQRALSLPEPLVIEHLNQSSPRVYVAEDDITPSFIEVFREFHSADYALYEEACRIE